MKERETLSYNINVLPFLLLFLWWTSPLDTSKWRSAPEVNGTSWSPRVSLVGLSSTRSRAIKHEHIRRLSSKEDTLREDSFQYFSFSSYSQTSSKVTWTFSSSFPSRQYMKQQAQHSCPCWVLFWGFYFIFFLWAYSSDLQESSAHCEPSHACQHSVLSLPLPSFLSPDWSTPGVLSLHQAQLLSYFKFFIWTISLFSHGWMVPFRLIFKSNKK